MRIIVAILFTVTVVTSVTIYGDYNCYYGIYDWFNMQLMVGHYTILFYKMEVN